MTAVVKNISGLIPVLFMSVPFLTTVNVLNDSRRLQQELENGTGCAKKGRNKKILWFTDTMTDLNGPSETIQKLVWLSFDEGFDLIPLPVYFVTNIKNCFLRILLIYNSMDLYAVVFFGLYTAGSFDCYHPKMISNLEPDEILISTPGPVGYGLLCARLLHIPCKGIYHTDFSEQAMHIIGDDTVLQTNRRVCKVVLWYVR